MADRRFSMSRRVRRKLARLGNASLNFDRAELAETTADARTLARQAPDGYPGTMTDEFEKGDKVVWSSHGEDDTPGVVERKITSDTELAGRTVRASEDEPQYLVRSEKGGGQAVHKPGALKRR